MRTSHRDRGFTLVEILIAIVLVGILSAVVVVGVGSLTSKGRGAACSSSLDAARTASSARLVTVGSYPTTLAQLVSEGGISTASGTSLAAGGTTIAGSSWRLALVAGAANTPPTFVCLTDVIDLDATGAITRSVTGLTPGTAYTLTFITAKHRVASGPPTARVDIGGASLTWSPNNPSSGAFQVMSLVFTPSSSTVTLTFTGTGSPSPCCGVIVDDPVIGVRTG